MFDSFKSIQTRVKKQSRDWTRPRCFTRACRTRKDVYYIQPEPDSSSQVENTNLFRTFLTLFLSRKGRLLYICISKNYARETQILDMFHVLLNGSHLSDIDGFNEECFFPIC